MIYWTKKVLCLVTVLHIVSRISWR